MPHEVAESMADQEDHATRFRELVHLAEQLVGLRVGQRRIGLVE
jgi:hypothetical protein